MPDRNWDLIAAKREQTGGRCVVCGKADGEAAHIVGREHDRTPPLMLAAYPDWQPYLVVPERIVWLCGPATEFGTCHFRYDGPASARAGLNVLAHLSLEEQLQAVADCRGIAPALTRITGSETGFTPIVGAQVQRDPVIRLLPGL